MTKEEAESLVRTIATQRALSQAQCKELRRHALELLNASKIGSDGHYATSDWPTDERVSGALEAFSNQLTGVDLSV